MMRTKSTWHCLIVWLFLGSVAYAQMPQGDFGKNMQKAQAISRKYKKEEKKRERKRERIIDKIAKEEMKKAKAKKGGPLYDSMAEAEGNTNRRVRALKKKWRKEDEALKAKKQKEMQEAMGMGDMMKRMKKMQKQHQGN